MKASWACLALLSAVISASAAEYEVDGQLEQALNNWGGSVGALERSRFTVYVKDCSWLIQTTDEDTNGKPTIIRETACAGGEIHEVYGRINKETHNGVRAWNMATIVSNTVPVGQNKGYFVSHLWLMFASGCYFASLTTNRLTPVYDVNASVLVDPHMTRKAKWELADGPGSLPLSVVYFEDFSPIKNATNASYVATGVTNAGTIKIPSGFVFEGDGTRTVVTVTAVRPYCSRTDFIPTAEGKTMVIDRRQPDGLTNIHPPTYIVKEGVQWLPPAQAEKSYIKPVTPPKPVSRWIVAVMLLLPTAVFLSFLWWNRKKG